MPQAAGRLKSMQSQIPHTQAAPSIRTMPTQWDSRGSRSSIATPRMAPMNTPTKRESPTWRVCSRELCMHTMQAMQE